MTEHLRRPPVITIAQGVDLPAVGFGRYLISDDEVSGAVGRAINAALAAGPRRDDLFVTTKLDPGHRREHVSQVHNGSWTNELA